MLSTEHWAWWAHVLTCLRDWVILMRVKVTLPQWIKPKTLPWNTQHLGVWKWPKFEDLSFLTCQYFKIDSQQLEAKKICPWAFISCMLLSGLLKRKIKVLDHDIKYMYDFSNLCKMRCPLNLVLENFKYLWFYLTFWVVISNGSLKLPKLSICILVILQKWVEIHEIIDWSTPCFSFSVIFVMEKFK